MAVKNVAYMLKLRRIRAFDVNQWRVVVDDSGSDETVELKAFLLETFTRI